MQEMELPKLDDPCSRGASVAIGRRDAFKRITGIAMTAAVGIDSPALAETQPNSALQTVRIVEKDWRERLSDLFFHGELIADVLKDGTKAVLLGGALSLINLLLSEQREAQRTKQVRDYADLLKLREAAEPTGSIGIIPADYIQERIEHLETVLPVPRRRTEPVTQRTRPHRHVWDTIFSMVPAIMLVLIAGIMALAAEDKGSLGFFQILEVILALLIVLFLAHRLGRWTSGVLDNLIVRRISQVFISATICFVAFIVCAVVLFA